jgi:hypothetical protein
MSAVTISNENHETIMKSGQIIAGKAAANESVLIPAPDPVVVWETAPPLPV